MDGEARWIKKMGRLHFGYKRHSVTDENGLVLAEETTAANESDIKHLETPLKKANLPKKTLVYADKGYDSAENKETLARMKLKSRIMHKGTRAHKITEREKRINVAISKIRYRVERTFGSIHRWFRGRYGKICRTCQNTCTAYYGGCCLQLISNARDNCVQCSQIKENWTQI